MHSERIITQYGNKVRVRTCGVLIRNSKILLLNHNGINDENIFWSFPGGGVNFGESLEKCLIRECEEECNISIEVKNFIYLDEYINKNFHAIELLYLVSSNDTPSLGKDPELENSFHGIKWFSLDEIIQVSECQKHSFLSKNIHLIDNLMQKCN